jgi:hypothetical protein
MDMGVRSRISTDIRMSRHRFPCYNQRDGLYRSEASLWMDPLFFPWCMSAATLGYDVM